MTEWRIRGFVGDSEDEDEEINGDARSTEADFLAFTGVSRNDQDECWTVTPLKSSEHPGRGGGRNDAEKDGGNKKPTAALQVSQSQMPTTIQTLSENAKNPLGDHILYTEGRRLENLTQLNWQGQYSGVSTASSSPLSEVPPSPLIDARHVRSDRSKTPDFLRLNSSSHEFFGKDQANSPGQRDKNEETQIEINHGASRTFRRRNPIQLHPYLLENEQYRQSLKARGLRPVDVAIDTRNSPGLETSHELSHGSQNADNDYILASQSRSRSPTVFLSSPPTIHSGPAMNSFMSEDGNEDFPDLASILRQPSDQIFRSRFKRRKLAPNSSDDSTEVIQNAASSMPTPETVSPRPSADLMSPIASRLQTTETSKKQRLRRFKVPRTLTPAPLPTPLPSSDLVNPIGDVFDVMSSDEEILSPKAPRDSQNSLHHESRRNQKRPTVVIQEDSESSESELRQIRRAQKKTRGVLPASWARLDKHAQTAQTRFKDPAPVNRISASKTPLQQRGVAQRVVHGRQPSLGSTSLLNGVDQLQSSAVSDESDTPSMNLIPEKPSRQRSSLLQLSEQVIGHFEDETQDIVEEDWIDDMVQPVPRRKRRHQIDHHKRQSTLTNAFQRNRQLAVSIPKSLVKGLRSKRSHASRRRPPAIGRRGVLDAPTSSGEPLPNFIKVASRNARSRRDHGRHSPSQKIILLHDGEDQDEVDNMMRNWRAGTIELRQYERHIEPKLPAFRPPLIEQAPNQQQRLKQNTQQFPRRISPKKLLSTKKQTVTLPRKSKRSQTRIDSFAQLQYVPEGFLDDNTIIAEVTQKLVVAGNENQPLKTSIRRIKPAQLEDLEEQNDFEYPQAAFKRNLSRIDRQYELRDSYHKSSSRPLIARLLGNVNESWPSNVPEDQPGPTPASRLPPPGDYQHVSRDRRRKRPPRRLVSKAMQVRVDPSPEAAIPKSVVSHSSGPEKRYPFEGLREYGSSYSIDFGVLALPAGTYFHESTLIGSGLLKDALALKTRDVMTRSGSTSITYGSTTTTWSLWNEEVSSELGLLFNYCRSNMQSLTILEESTSCLGLEYELPKVLRSLMQYFSKSLSFSDTIDRRSFIARMAEQLNMFFGDIESVLTLTPMDPSWHVRCNQIRIQLLTVLAILTFQVNELASDPVVDISRKQDIERLMRNVCYALVRDWLQADMDSLDKFFQKLTIKANRDIGIREDSIQIESIIVVMHLLHPLEKHGHGFWDAVNHTLLESLHSQTLNAEACERIWRSLFTLLPLLDFDSFGILGTLENDHAKEGDWTAIKILLSQVFETYSSGKFTNMGALNAYIRAMLCRCHQLIQIWGWRKCESVLNVVFDFFARNELALLAGEEGRGSPNFLEELRHGLVLNLETGDRSFHIFLKMLGAGLFSMRHVYSNKKIRSIAWRFIPNHGRLYKKDEDLRRGDLDALRNHHDLLCVLYWASPRSYRPSLDMIRNLVDFGSSHLEACRLNVRAWANLARFTISVDEPTDEFSLWFHDILKNLVAQHRLAKTEAESYYHATNASVSRDLLQSVIGNNQRQIEAIISTALASFKEVLQQSTQLESASSLILNSAISEIFMLFDSTQPRMQGTVSVALDVVSTYAQVIKSFKYVNPQQSNEDSQDYGDWPMYEDVVETDSPDKLDFSRFDQSISSPLFHLLSNAFGADISPDDLFLKKLVETWVSIAHIFIEYRKRDWTQYIDPYGQYAWNQLRDTEQTRKYSTYFVSTLITADSDCFDEHFDTVLAVWLTSLVERESVLKFQHEITNCILNAAPDDQLLRNLPFIKKSSTGKFQITLSELRERRLSLISSVLSNMRNAVEDAFFKPQEDADHSVRPRFVILLKELMSAMKRNFLDTQVGSSTRGSYVDFVQKVIEFLQQYTIDICPVDKFFTESTAFPLPTNDPLYVVGRLKSYGVAHVDAKNQKKLAVFLQTISERAAVAGQQQYLAEQLHKAVSGPFERSESTRPSLRRVALQAIFPSYIECAQQSVHGWILAWPVLAASKKILDEHIYQFNTTDPLSAVATREILESFCDALLYSVQPSVSENLQSLVQPHSLFIIRLIFEALASLLALVDYLSRSSIAVNRALDTIEFFTGLARHLHDVPSLTWHSADLQLPSGPSVEDQKEAYAELRSFCRRELKDAGRYWAVRGKDYYLSRGHAARLVVVDDIVGTLEVERGRLLDVVKRFLTAVQRMGLGGYVGKGIRKRGEYMLGSELLF